MNNKKVFDKRQFYNNDDSGKTFVFAVLLPYILSFVLSLVLVAIAGGDSDKAQALSLTPAVLIVGALCGPLAFILIYLLYSKAFNISFKASTITNKPSWQSILVSIAVALVSLFGLYALINCHDALLQTIGFKLDDTLKLLPMSNAGWLVLYLIVFAMLPALAEELLFRGLIMQGLRKNMSDGRALLLSALMFALMHTSLQQFVYPLILGLILGWIALRTGSVVCSMIVHFLNNALVVVFAYLEVNKNFSFAPFQNVWWYYLVAFAAAAATGVIIYLLDRFVFKHKNKNEVEKEPVARISIFVWVGIIVSVILLVISAIVGFLG